MAQGTVKYFNADKGMGAITQDGGSEELFVHYSAIKGDGYRTLEEGQRVEFQVQRAPRGGVQATEVRVI